MTYQPANSPPSCQMTCTQCHAPKGSTQHAGRMRESRTAPTRGRPGHGSATRPKRRPSSEHRRGPGAQRGPGSSYNEMRRGPAHLSEADVAEESDIAGRPGHAGESRRLWRVPGAPARISPKPPYVPRAVACRRDNARVEPKRLLVLGAGPPQLGLLAAARRRNVFVIAVDRDPSAPGFQYADRRALISVEDEPAIERLAAAERIDGIIAPGDRLRGRDRGPSRGAARARASDLAQIGAARDLQAPRAGAVRPKRAFRSRTSKCVPRRNRQCPPPAASAIPASSSRPTATASAA